MSFHSRQRGAAKVGLLRDLPPLEISAVLYLRMWFDSDHARQKVWNEFASTLGPDRGRVAVQSLEELCHLISDHARRPIMRHGVACACLGADEAVFSQLVGAAGDGQREDAMLFAMLLVRADFAPCMIAGAEALALALRQMELAEMETPPGRVLH